MTDVVNDEVTDHGDTVQATRSPDSAWIVLPPLGEFAEMLTAAMRVAAAVGDRGTTTSSPAAVLADVPADVEDLADALHLGLEPVYGDPHRPVAAALPGIEDFVQMVARVLQRRPARLPVSVSAREQLVACGLYLLLAPPSAEDAIAVVDDGGVGDVGYDGLAGFVLGGLEPDRAWRVAVALLRSAAVRGRLREVVAAHADLSLGSGQEWDRPQAVGLRADMAGLLAQRGTVRTEAVHAALTTVSRELFLPGFPLREAYDPYAAHGLSRDASGRTLSSVSAPWMHAVILERAGLAAGMRVLEIGSGGYGAALLAEMVGPGGQVISVDIDTGVVLRARICLGVSGYLDRVEVVHGDGVHGVVERAPFDRIVVTASTWDIPPAWFEQLAKHGRLVAPLRLCHTTRLVALDRVCDGSGERLVGGDPLTCSFVTMRGVGSSPEAPVCLHHDGVTLWADDDVVTDLVGLRAALHDPPTLVATGVEVGNWDDEADDHLPLALTLPRLGMLIASPAVVEAGLLDPAARAGVPVLVEGASLAYRACHASLVTAGCQELVVIGHGLAGADLARRYADALTRWDRQRRSWPGPRVEVWPGASFPAEALRPGSRVLRRPSGVIVVSPGSAP